MLTDEIINKIYEHELHPRYSKVGRIILYIISFILTNFTVYVLVSDKDIKAAIIQAIVAICMLLESQSKKGFSTEFIDELVSKLTEINLNISKVKDNKFRVEAIKQFNYYIDIIVDKPNGVSKLDLNQLNKKILSELKEEESIDYDYNEEETYSYNERQRKAEEKAEKERHRQEYERQRQEYERQEYEKRRKEREKQKQEQEKTRIKHGNINNEIKYFEGCFTMDELNKRKKELLKQYHPDNHSNELEKEQCENISKQISEQYIIAKNTILSDFDI